MSNLGSDSQHSSDDKVVHIYWTVPGTSADESCTSSSSAAAAAQRIARQQQQRVQRCVDLAISCANDFENNFQTYSADREKLVPQFHPDEIDLLQMEAATITTTSTENTTTTPAAVTSNVEAIVPVRVAGFYKEYILRDIELLPETKDGVNDPSQSYYKAKKHFTKRSRSEFQYYSVKLLQDGIMETDHGPYATTEMIVETKILMNLSSQHPHILKIYGISSSNIATLSSSRLLNGQDSYFFITDRISETLTERIEQWRQLNQNHFILPSSTANATPYQYPTTIDEQKQPLHITKRLEIALDVASALIFLHDRDVVYYVRPDKIGFDIRYGVVKLCYFGQCRQNNMESNPRSVTQSDNMSVLAYTAPEVFCMAPAHTVADVYGFGILLWEMICLQRPYHGYDRCQHFENVVRNHLRPLDMNTDDNTWDKDIAKLIKRCIRPYQRPTMKKIHTTIETKLLYYEPGGDGTNDIIDTAQTMQRRHSAGLFDQVMRQTKGHTEPIVASVATTSTNVPTNSKRRKSSSKKSSTTESKIAATEGLPTTTKESDERLQASDDTLNSSALSLLSGGNLDDILQDVSDKLSGGTGADEPEPKKVSSRRNSINNRELARGSRHSASRRSRDRVQDRRFSKNGTIKTRRSRSRSGYDEQPNTTSDKSKDPSDLNKRLDKDNLEKGDFDSIGDDEDLIASIMSQSDESLVPHIPAIDPGTPTQYSYKVAEVRKSIIGNRSPIRLRQRSRSRSTSRTRAGHRNFKQPSNMLPGDGADESVAESELPVVPSPPITKPKLKLSPAQAVENVSRKARYSSNPRSSREDTLSNNIRPKLTRGDSDSTLGIRRKRRTTVAEVKEKFDFIPDSPQKKASNKNLKGLQNVLERVSPIRAPTQQLKKEKYPTSPTNPLVQKGMKLLNGVLRRGSSKEAVVLETAPVRRQIRRGSGSLVQNLVLEQSSSRLVLDVSHDEKTPCKK
jgi:hypothetical protein